MRPLSFAAIGQVVDATTTAQDDEGRNLLTFSLERGKFNIVQSLLEIIDGYNISIEQVSCSLPEQHH